MGIVQIRIGPHRMRAICATVEGNASFPASLLSVIDDWRTLFRKLASEKEEEEKKISLFFFLLPLGLVSTIFSTNDCN